MLASLMTAASADPDVRTWHVLTVDDRRGREDLDLAHSATSMSHWQATVLVVSVVGPSTSILKGPSSSTRPHHTCAGTSLTALVLRPAGEADDHQAPLRGPGFIEAGGAGT